MGKKEVVDPRQQLITKFFQVKDAEEMGKFECSDCLNQKWKNGIGQCTQHQILLSDW